MSSSSSSSSLDYSDDFAVCTTLYKTKWLFPASPEREASIFYGVLLGFSLLIILYIVLRVRRQRSLLSRGQITKMKQWLLPVYYRFLWFVVLIYAIKAIDIVVVYIAFEGHIECNMPELVAFVHASSFWTSEIWLFDVLFLFLASNSHGIGTIRRAFWSSTLLWVCNAVAITLGITDCTFTGFLYYSCVYAVQIVLVMCLMLFMCVKAYPHHRYLWVMLAAYLTVLLCRFSCDFLRYNEYDAFCLMDIADYIASIAMPWLVIYTLRKDSKHWSTLSIWMQAANRGSIYNTFSLHVDGHERQSMTVWSELLSQHTKILKSESLTPLDTSKKVIGGSGSVTKARYKGQVVAIKEWRFEHFTKHVIALWCKEALISSNFRHKNVVKLIGICIEPPSIKIVMQWCRHGALRKLLISRRALPWSLRFQLLLDVAEGMAHLHRNGLVHRDLKTLNLLVDEDRHGHYVVRICDFGSSRSVDLDEYYNKFVTGQSENNLLNLSNLNMNMSQNTQYNSQNKSVLSFASTALTTDTMTTNNTNITNATNPHTMGGVHKNTHYNRNNNNYASRGLTNHPNHQNNQNSYGSYHSHHSNNPNNANNPNNYMRTTPSTQKRGYSSRNENNNNYSVSGSKSLLDRIKMRMFNSSKQQNSVTYSEVADHPPNDFDHNNTYNTHNTYHPNNNLLHVPQRDGNNETETQSDMMNNNNNNLLEMSITSQLLHSVASPMSTIVGSVQFLAPEILENIEFKQGSRSAKSKQNSVYGFSADVYSYGCVIWEMVTRREIYKGKSYLDIQKFVLSNKRPIVMESELTACPDANFLLKLMDQCWQQDPQMRPNFNQIIQMLEEKRDKFIPPPSMIG